MYFPLIPGRVIILLVHAMVTGAGDIKKMRLAMNFHADYMKQQNYMEGKI